MAISASDIKRIKALQQKKFRQEFGLFIAEGIKTVEELVLSNYTIQEVYSTENLDFLEPLEGVLVHEIKNKELERISGLKSPNKVLAVAEIPKTEHVLANESLVLLLDGIKDPGNLGTIIRTAKWFGIETVFCSEECVDTYNPKVVQSIMGALFHVKVYSEDLTNRISLLKKNGFQVIGSTMQGTSVYECKREAKIALVIGSESHGISQSILELCDKECSIPNNEKKRSVESLNAAVASSILLSELTRPR